MANTAPDCSEDIRMGFKLDSDHYGQYRLESISDQWQDHSYDFNSGDNVPGSAFNEGDTDEKNDTWCRDKCREIPECTGWQTNNPVRNPYSNEAVNGDRTWISANCYMSMCDQPPLVPDPNANAGIMCRKAVSPPPNALGISCPAETTTTTYPPETAPPQTPPPQTQPPYEQITECSEDIRHGYKFFSGEGTHFLEPLNGTTIDAFMSDEDANRECQRRCREHPECTAWTTNVPAKQPYVNAANLRVWQSKLCYVAKCEQPPMIASPGNHDGGYICRPSTCNTQEPTYTPSAKPTLYPSDQPSVQPTDNPSKTPSSAEPTYAPVTADPASIPTTSAPSDAPVLPCEDSDEEAYDGGRSLNENFSLRQFEEQSTAVEFDMLAFSAVIFMISMLA